MTSGTFSPSTYADLVDLGRRLYEQALVRREQELITDPRGQPIGWLLDTRIPMLEGRIGPGNDQLGARTSDEDLTIVLKSLKKRPLDYFKQDFYADTAVFGAKPSSAFNAAEVCARTRNSRICPSKVSEMITAAASKYTPTRPCSTKLSGKRPGAAVATTL